MNENNTVAGAKLGKRIGALLLDGLIVGVAYMVVCGIVGAIYGAEEMMAIAISPEYAAISPAARIMAMSMPVIMFLYGVLMESGKKAATVGKRVTKIKVVKTNGTKAKVLDIMVRNVMKALPLLLTAIFTNTLVTGLVGILELVYFILPLCNKNHRAIHDLVGGTIVADRDQTAEVIPPINIELPVPPQVAAQQAAAAQQAVLAEDVVKTVAPMVTNKLLGVGGQYNDAVFPLDAPLVLGRDSSKCNVIFANDTQGVSKVHCSIKAENGRIILKDLGSTYGIIVNGSTRLSANEAMELRMGDRFTIGKSESFMVK